LKNTEKLLSKNGAMNGFDYERILEGVATYFKYFKAPNFKELVQWKNKSRLNIQRFWANILHNLLQ
jgi:hypothetical protein